MKIRLSPTVLTAAYQAAHPRFVEYDSLIDGQAVRVREDPVLPLRVALPVADASRLAALFKATWTSHLYAHGGVQSVAPGGSVPLVAR